MGVQTRVEPDAFSFFKGGAYMGLLIWVGHIVQTHNGKKWSRPSHRNQRFVYFPRRFIRVIWESGSREVERHLHIATQRWDFLRQHFGWNYCSLPPLSRGKDHWGGEGYCGHYGGDCRGKVQDGGKTLDYAKGGLK